MTKPQSCATCAYALFPLTPTGRIKRNYVGQCGAPIPVIDNMPDCVELPVLRKTHIWIDHGITCPVWKPKAPSA